MNDEQENQTTMPGMLGAAMQECEAARPASPDVLERARDRVKYQSDGRELRHRAVAHAERDAEHAARLAKLAERLTPDVENAIWCLRESIALGLVDLNRDRYEGEAALKQLTARVRTGY